MRTDLGDWIIRGVQGGFYPCKPNIFDTTHEPAEDGPMRVRMTWNGQAAKDARKAGR